MEVFLDVWVALFIIFIIVCGLLGALSILCKAVLGLFGTVGAAFRTATGRGSFTENLQAEFRGLRPFEIKCKRVPANSDVSFEVIEIKAKGVFPVSRRRRLAFIISVLDETTDQLKPVHSVVDAFQEPETICYQHRVEVGEVDPGSGFISWVRAGVVVPAMLVPPVGGERKLLVVLRLVDLDQKANINKGFGEKNDAAVVGQHVLHITQTFKTKGYEEQAEAENESRALTVKLAVAVAMADGSMDETEAQTISAWITKSLSELQGARRKRVKEVSNKAFKEAYKLAQRSELSLSQITADLNVLADEPYKYQAVELCFDVMAADGHADPDEIETICRIASALDINYDELQKMKDQRMVKLSPPTGAESAEAILGIDPTWSKERVRKYLRGEFAKWNGRLNSLSDPDERQRAQEMLNLIAEQRKKHV
ncbi:MAG: TerB family tellurite resistance protein [Rhodospirillales bacterium]|nr:TerB family tellurite resistance protein [Rhodospirillales bacterium]